MQVKLKLSTALERDDELLASDLLSVVREEGRVKLKLRETRVVAL
jgi:hypothetical protein